MLKGIVSKSVCLISLISIILSVIMPFNIHAEETTPTYYVVDGCFDGYGFNSTSQNTVKIGTSSSEIRYVMIKGPVNYYFGFVSKNPFTYQGTNISGGCPVYNPSWYNNAISYTYNGTTYYINHNYFSNNIVIYNSDFPIIYNNSVTGNDFNDSWLVRYSFGDLAVDPAPPAPPVQSGDLTFNYYTDFASSVQSGDAVKSNRDTITWSYDSTNSNIPLLDLKVDLRAVPVNYYASTETALYSLGWSDLHLELTYASDLGSYQINNGKVSYTWEQVVDNFRVHTNLPSWMDTVMNFWSNGFYNFYNDQYYTSGWVYQIRLNTYSGDYTGEWQTIYTVPSAPPEGQQQTINYYVNGNGVTEPIYQTIQNINNNNNITNNNWYVNGNPFDVNSDDGDNWLTKLIQMILDAVFGTLGKLTDAIVSLIIGSLEAIIDFFTDIWDRFLNLFDTINFTNDNPDYDLDFDLQNEETNSPLRIVPEFVNMLFQSGLGYYIWLPLVVGIIFIVL